MAYYTNTEGTFGNIRAGSGALYSTEQDTTPIFGTLPVAQGGTGVTSFTANQLIISGNSTTSALTTRAITNTTSATAATVGTNIPTMNTLYYALPKINNAKTYTSNSSYYAPIAGGTANTQALVGDGATTAPKWIDINPSCEWTAGTAAGPTLKVTVLGQTQTTDAIIPSASTTASGIVTTKTQSFKGNKTF